MVFDPFALVAIIIFALLLPFMLFILIHTARRAGQEEWDRAAEQGRHRQRLPKRPYTQRYIDALDGEPGPRRPQVKMSRSKTTESDHTSARREVNTVGGSAVMRAVDDDDGWEGLLLWMCRCRCLRCMIDLDSGRPNSHVQAHTDGDQAWRGAKIDEIWFDGV